MNKSFYYVISWLDAARLRRELTHRCIPFTVEQLDGQLAIVFPDLHVRVYQQLLEVFNEHPRSFE